MICTRYQVNSKRLMHIIQMLLKAKLFLLLVHLFSIYLISIIKDPF